MRGICIMKSSHRPLSGLLLCLTVTFPRAGVVAEVNLAILMPYTGFWPIGRTMAGAIPLAIEKVNNDPAMLPRKILKYTWNDTSCDTGRGIGEMVDLHVQSWENLHAYIGPGCDEICEPTGLLAAHWNLPMISWGCQSSWLSHKSDYPTFARTVGPYPKIAGVFPAIWKQYGWKQGSLMVSGQHMWQLAGEELKLKLIDSGLSVNEFRTFEAGHKDMLERQKAAHRDVLEELIHHSRIIILCAYGGDVRDIMLSALDLGLLGGDHVFIAIDLDKAARFGVNTWMGDDGRDQDAERAFQGLLNVHLLTPKTPEYLAFEDEVRARSALPPFNNPLPVGQKIDVHAGMIYDAILLYAHALNDAMAEGYNELDGLRVAQKMFNRTYQGITGKITIDENGDRNPDFAVQSYNDGEFYDYAEFPYNAEALILIAGVKIYFPGGSTTPPKDHPRCGWDNELCQKKDMAAAIAGAVVSVIFLAVLIVGILMYRKVKQTMDFNNQQLWRIKWEDLHMLNAESMTGSKQFGSKRTSQNGSTFGGSRQGDSNLNGLNNTVGTKSSGTMMTSRSDTTLKQIFVTTAQYKGLVVALKPKDFKPTDPDRVLLEELKTALALQHENLNAYCGLCVDDPNNYVVSIYCARGSLQDVLENDALKLNNDFKLSFAMDICKGMEFIHSSALQTHGRIKSSNCLVDNRWVVKMADYGLFSLRGEIVASGDDADDYKTYQGLLWTAPELLRQASTPIAGSKKGDVYSYGIVLQEIACRGGPYCDQDKEPREILELVQRGLPPFRPLVTSEQCPEALKSLMSLCWHENPDKRPSFSTVHRMLKAMNNGREINVMDNMIKMMEKYADHLEELVGSRTQELEEEKKKTEVLLYQMLPKSVAEKLKVGHYVSPEAFPAATVYFSDIVGFTKIAAESSPLQVVDFLNDLYSTFDEIIELHDVYKVETIGDAYMVVSGVPEQNGDRHAGAIASMSLDVLSSVTSFKIKHLPEKQLQLRIGLHSGSVVAGVVGQKMPRYCLFGDTVNVAARMESGGLALRIHLSEATKNLLLKLGGYFLENRGTIDVKGKGSMKTFWLSGKQGFNRTLPDINKAAAIEDHEFK